MPEADPESPVEECSAGSLLRRALRSVVLGLAIGFGLVAALRYTPEGEDLPLAIGVLAVVVAGLAVRRWLLFRRERKS